jgi:signal transduction histidine kinase
VTRTAHWTITEPGLDDSGRDPALEAGSPAVLQRHGTLVEASEVARSLHDGLAQTLFAIASAAKELRGRESLDARARREVETILELAQAGLRELREAFRSLGGAGRVSRRGLAAAISSLHDEAPGLEVEIAIEPELREARDEVAELLYRTCREGLANSSRHAHATRCRLRVGLAGSTATATVEDDGEGANP